MNLYLFSGLGADERVFESIEFGGIKSTLIKWISPEKNESLEEYAQRLRSQIKEEDEIYLLGVSFGGMVAQEMSKSIPCKKVILISTVEEYRELSFPLKVIQRIRIDKWLGGKTLRELGKWFGPFFFSLSSHENKKVLRSIISDTDSEFLLWAVDRIMKWRGGSGKGEMVRIHGDADRIFPLKNKKNISYVVENGGHFMIMNRAKEIEKIIHQEILP